MFKECLQMAQSFSENVFLSPGTWASSRSFCCLAEWFVLGSLPKWTHLSVSKVSHLTEGSVRDEVYQTWIGLLSLLLISQVCVWGQAPPPPFTPDHHHNHHHPTKGGPASFVPLRQKRVLLMPWLLLHRGGLMGFKCGSCHRRQPGAY